MAPSAALQLTEMVLRARKALQVAMPARVTLIALREAAAVRMAQAETLLAPRVVQEALA